MGILGREYMRKTTLQFEVVLNRPAIVDLGGSRELAVLRLEQREHTALRGKPRHLDRVGRARTPSQSSRPLRAFWCTRT